MKQNRRPLFGVPAPVSRALRALLAIALVWSEGTSAWATQDLWSDRRRAIRAARSGPTARSSPWDQLVASFPTFEKDLPLPLPGPTAQTPLPDWLESTVGLNADVGESHPPSRGERRVLIHIQDLHEVEEAQRNTSAVLERLAVHLGGKRGLLVGLEGAAGGFLTADYRSLASPPIIRRTASRFLRAGIISGPEFFSLTTENPFRLWGVEDPRAYAANIRALTDTFPLQAKDDATVARARANVEKLKEKFYPPTLKEFDQFRTQYEMGGIGLAAYVRRLSSGTPAEWVGPTLRLFLQATAQEDELSFSRVAKEQAKLLENLAPRLSESELSRLVERGLSLRVGRVSFSRFYALLKSVCEKHALSLRDYPCLGAYADYAGKAEGLNPLLLLQEVETLADKSRKSLLSTPSLVEIAALDDDVRLVDKLNRFVLTPEGYRNLVLRRAAIRRWHERGATMGGGAWPDLTPLMERHEKFYLQAEIRNAPLVQNMLPLWTDGEPAVLVAGGYHAEGVRAAALAQGLGYVSLIPRVTSTKNLPPPLESFRSNVPQKERVFRGDQSGLHQPLLTAREQVGGDFLQSFFAVAAAEEAISMVGSTKNPFDASFVKRLNLELQKISDAAKGVGWYFECRVEKVERAENGDALIRLNYSYRDRGDTTTFNGVVTVSVAGNKAGDVTVKFGSLGFLSTLSSRWGLADLEASLLRRINAAWDWMSMSSTRVQLVLGHTAQKAGTLLVSPLVRIGPKWLSSQIRDWGQSLRLAEDRRLVKMAFMAPAGVQNPMLFRLAEARRGPIEKLLEGSLAKSIESIVSDGENPHMNMSDDRQTMTVEVPLDRTPPLVVEIGITKSRALGERHLPYQLIRTPEGKFRVFLTGPSVSRAEITPLVMGGIFREIRALAEGKSASEARQIALSPLDQRILEWHFLITENMSFMEAVDNLIAAGIAGSPVQLKKMEMSAGQITEWLNDSTKTIDLLSGEEPLSNRMNVDFSLLRTFIKPLNDLSMDEISQSIQGLKIISDYSNAGRGRGFFSFHPERSSSLSHAEELIVNRLSAVGSSEGRLLSNRETSLYGALAANLQEKFLPLAQSLLGFLSDSGVQWERAGPREAVEFVNIMMRLYAAHFIEGFERGYGRPVDVSGLAGGVFHLQSPVAESPIVDQLLDALMAKPDPSRFRGMLLVDFETQGDDGSILDQVAARLEQRPDTEARKKAMVVLKTPGNLLVRRADDFRVNGAISLERVLEEVHAQWNSLPQVGVYTSAADAFLQDATNTLLSWVLIVDGKIVSKSVEDAALKQAIRDFVRRQA